MKETVVKQNLTKQLDESVALWELTTKTKETKQALMNKCSCYLYKSMMDLWQCNPNQRYIPFGPPKSV